MKTTRFLFLFITLFSFFSSYSQGYYIKDFDVSIQLETDGTFSVREEIDVFFTEERRGIIRSIPTRAIINEKEVSMKIRNMDVPDWKYKENNQGGTINIRIGDPNIYLTGDQTYVINYNVENALVRYPDHIEFFWNMTGNYWDTRIENTSFEIRLPEEIGNLPFNYVAYSGMDGVKGTDVTIDHIGKIIAGNSTTTLNPNEGVSVALNLPLGFMNESNIQSIETLDKSEDVSKPYSIKDEGSYPFLPAALLAFLFGAYRRHGINEGKLKEDEISEKYYPPDDMNPAEVGTFYDFKVNSRDLIALIPKWGNQGCVEVKSIPDDKGDPDLYFYKLKRLPLESPQYELDFFNDLFKDGDQVFIGDLKNKFYKDMSKAKSKVDKEIKKMKLYDSHSIQYFKRWPSIVGLILCMIGGVLLMVFGRMFITGSIMILIADVLVVFLIRRPKLTEKGLSLHNDLRGFYKFLKNPKPSKLNQLINHDNQYLEKVFPYVVAFGLDNTWNKNIARQYPDYTPPPWYFYQNNDGTRNTTTSWSEFGTSFNVKTINSVFSSAPHSSGGGSGGFSGGSSGGGFGGGGGSSW